MEERWGILEWRGLGAQRVRLRRRSRWGAWRVSFDDVPRAPHARVAWLLPPMTAGVIEGPRGSVDARRVRLERILGTRLSASSISADARREGAILARRDALARAPEGTCGVPVPVALAALAALIPSRQRIGVYWEWAGTRVHCVARRGRVMALRAATHRHLTWLLLSEPDPTGCAVLARFRPRRLLSRSSLSLPRLSSLELVVLGGALAPGFPGTYPEPGPPWRSRVGTALAGLLPWVGIAGGVAICLHAEHSVTRLEAELERTHRNVERLYHRSPAGWPTPRRETPGHGGK